MVYNILRTLLICRPEKIVYGNTSRLEVDTQLLAKRMFDLHWLRTSNAHARKHFQ